MLGLLPPSSSVTFFRLPVAACTISLPTSVEPVKATLSTSSWAARAAPAVSPKPVTTFTTPSGMPASAMSWARKQRGQRRLLGRLEHHAVARGQGRAELPRGHQQREVPRDDLADDADRLAQRVGVEVGAWHVGHRDVDRVALDLGGPAGHVVEQVRRQRHVRAARHADRLAVVERLELGELLGVLEDEVADLPDEAASLGRRHAAPRAAFEGVTRGADRPVDVFGISLGHVGEGLPGGRVGGLERLTGRRLGPLSADEQFPRGSREFLDAPVDGDSHEVPHLFQLL